MKKIIQLFILFFALSFTASILAKEPQSKSTPENVYIEVHLYNSTDLYMFSTIYYACLHPDVAYIDPYTQWTAKTYRGFCLLTYIETQGSHDGQHYDVQVSPYRSSGTGYDKFALIKEHGMYKTIRYLGN